jgi:Zn-dependent protease with chaperone function
VVEIIAGLILDLLVALLGSLGGGTGHPLGAVLFDLGSVISSILVAPIILVGLVLLYFDFRVRKEEFTSDQLSAHLAS